MNGAQRPQWWVEHRGKPAEAVDPTGSDTGNAVVGAAQVVEDVDENLDPWDDDLWERWVRLSILALTHLLSLLIAMAVTTLQRTPRCQRKLVYVAHLLRECRRDKDHLGSIGKTKTLDLVKGVHTMHSLLDGKS